MLKIDPKVFENVEGLCIGVIVAKDINNSSVNPEIEKLLREGENDFRQRYTPEGINQHENIKAWREVHKSFGSDSKSYMPSVWAIAKRVAKGGDLPSINSLVDIYNYICLKYLVPVGGEDLDKCDGDVLLTYATGDEEFYSIGSSESNPPEAGEIIYKDNKGVICRKFNWREADRTKLTKNTKNAILVIEVIPPVNKEKLEIILEELKQLVAKYCGRSLETLILESSINSDQPL